MNEAGMSIATSWLEWLYGEKLEGNISICGHGRWSGSRFADIDSAARYAMNFDAGQTGIGGTYHRLTTLNDSAPRRGVNEDSVTLYSVTLDLDLRGPGHVSDEYPETEEQLREVLEAAGLPEPSAWVNSGGGRYPHWKLTDPIRFTDGEEEFRRGRELLRSVQRSIAQQAAKRGWKLDNTSDLARVYRLPGTLNRKGETPVMATWAIGSGRTYDIHELQSPEAPAATPTPAAPMSDSGWPLFAAPSSILFDEPGAPRSDTRVFTLQEAMQYVARPLQNLREAPAGRINDTLNATACELAHFGPQFWDHDAAVGQILDALSHTDYDGQTWKAEDTIASAYAAMANDWQATIAAAQPPAHEMFSTEAAAATPGDEVDALLAEMISVREMIERPSPRFLIQGLLSMDSESWLIGAPGSKKSFVAFDMAARISRGEMWQGRRTNPADVVMIIAEGSGGSGKRGAAWFKAIGEIDDEHVRILPRPVQVGADFGKPWRVLAEACGRLADRASARGRGLLVIVDTQARVTVGLEENSAKEMGIYVEGVRLIRERTGGCVLSVHHTGRAGGDARGSSAIDGAQTSELKVESTGKLTGRLLTEKQKDLEHADPIELRFKSVPLGLDADGEPVSSLVLMEPGAPGWEGAEMTHEDIENGQREAEDPFASRTDLDPWILRHVANAPLQWWIVQALVDTVETLGLTETGVKEIVVSKRGKQSPSSWRKAWQKVTAMSGQWDGIVCPASGERWTVDRVAIAEKLVA